MTNAQLEKRRRQAMDLTGSKMEQERLSKACDSLRQLDSIINKVDFVQLDKDEVRFLMKLRTEKYWTVQKFWDDAHRNVIIDLLVSLDETRAELRKLNKQINNK